ncbi:transposase [Levilactobacillus zymae]|uniref:transposase n=1 Tax=Levilactobacillus zymae TaxID=267363 RepID=UPI003FCE068F
MVYFIDRGPTSFKKNYEAVLNSCRLSYSNEPIEGINRKIKTPKRIGYGFRNLTNFFNRIALIRE